jgi:hypothetical protein
VETALEHILASGNKAQMISYIDAHPGDFEELIQLACADKPLYSWRAAFLLWSCMDDNDHRIQKYIKTILHILPTKNANHQREILKILLRMEISEEDEGFLFDHCISVWKKIGNRPSIRHTAFRVIARTINTHAELYYEISFLIQNQYVESLSSAAKKSIFRMIKVPVPE